MANPENAVNVAKKLAEYALSLSYDKLPEKTIHEAKRALLDTMGVTLAAKGADAVQIMWKVLDSFKIEGTSTIIGSGKKTLPQYAALANGCMTRYWDYNDGYGYPMGKMVAASHPSEIIPICLALGESEKISGKELIVSIVWGMRFPDESCAPLRRNPWRPGDGTWIPAEASSVLWFADVL